jgi:hypothetical protein
MALPQERFLKGIFRIAGVYNIFWGAAVALFPNFLFRLFGLPDINYPFIMSGLGMCIGLYGYGYWVVAGETYSWNPEAPALAACRNSEPVWDAARKQAAAPCGNDIMVAAPDAVRLLRGHRDRVLGVAWSPGGGLLASVSGDNYVRVWNPESQRCVAVSQDYPYPRAIYFSGPMQIAK